MPPPPIQPAMLPPPGSTPVYRIIHIDNLATIVRRGQIHAPNHVPADGLPWRGIHAKETQEDRGRKPVANVAAAARVKTILAGSVHRPSVSVESSWYY